MVIPHGFDLLLLNDQAPSPYGPGCHAVSIGSMLFDRSFFDIAAPLFPDLTFHVIGAGSAADGLSAPNVRVYPIMPHAATIPFIRHANIGIAAYRDVGQPAYLTDSSMKLIQFAAFGLPSVCPHFAVGSRPERIPYDPGQLASIRHAIALAIERGKEGYALTSSWREAVDLITGSL